MGCFICWVAILGILLSVALFLCSQEDTRPFRVGRVVLMERVNAMFSCCSSSVGQYNEVCCVLDKHFKVHA